MKKLKPTKKRVIRAATPGYFFGAMKAADKVEVVKRGEGDDASAVVCRLAPQGEPLLLPDNLLGHCTNCFRMVQFRPHAPKTPPRICDECITAVMAKHQKETGDEEVKFLITEHTAADVAAYFRKKGLQ